MLLPGAPPVTLDALLRHHRTYGLDNAATGYRGRPETYKTYKTLRLDALVDTGRRSLSEDAYAVLIESVGYGKWVAEARADWRESHKAWAEERAEVEALTARPS